MHSTRDPVERACVRNPFKVAPPDQITLIPSLQTGCPLVVPECLAMQCCGIWVLKEHHGAKQDQWRISTIG